MRSAAALLFLCLLPAQRPVSGPAELEVLVTTEPNEARLDDADVEIQRLDRWRFASGRPEGQKCKTENGRCRFRVQPGNYLVIVSKHGYYDAVDPLSPRYAEQVTVQPLANFRLEVPLLPAGSVSGSVFTEDGKPVPQAFLRARLAEGDPRHAPLNRWVYSSSKGEFRLDDLPPGRYGLFLVPPESVRLRGLKRSDITGEFTGYAVQLFHPGIEESSWIDPVDITPGLRLENRTVVMRRFKVYSVAGALIEPRTREPLLDALVALRTGDEYSSELFAPRPVRGDGSFEFHSLAPGDYNLFVYRPGSEVPWIVPFAITATSQPDLLLAVPQWHPVTVEVRERWRIRHLPGTRLILEAEHNAGSIARSLPDAGEIHLGRVPPGDYQLRVDSEAGIFALQARQGEIDATTEQVRVTEGGASTIQMTLSDETGEILGTLIDGDGEPVGRGWVALVPANPKRRARGDLNRQLRVGTDGSFTMPQIPPGDYLLLGFPVRPPGGFNRPAFWEQYGRFALRLPIRPGMRLPVGLAVTERR